MEVSHMDRRNFLKSLLGLASLPFILPFPQDKPEANSKPKEVLLLETVVAGFFYYQGEKVWEKLDLDQPLLLLREPGNPHDERAVEVYWQQDKLGYIPRTDNSVIAQLMDREERLSTRISWLNESDNPWDRVGIEVSLRV